jgi:P-type Ca2+ transporter type 2C
MSLRAHHRPVAEVLEHLGTSSAGLSPDEVLRRRAEHGLNVLEEAPPRSMLALFLAQFADFMILVLLAAAVVSGLIGDLTDTLVIVAIVLLNAAIGFGQEFRAAKAMQALKAMAAPSAMVVRAGSTASVPAAELVPGDAVLLEAGRIVPADLRLVEAASLRIDEAALTGESVPVDKSTEALGDPEAAVGDRRNIAHKGTQVTYGRGLGVVVATGMRTEFGRIARLLEAAHAVETPLQRRLAVFGRRLALVVIGICGVVFATGLLRGEPALPMLLTALSLAVAAIPEALPAVVSISLALGARRLMARQALIRRLAAVEALGSVTVICSDKTGTLTANEMRVERWWCDGVLADAPGAAGPWALLLSAMAVSHDAAVGEDGALVGDPTEVALLGAARAAGLDHAAELARLPRVDEVPFDSARKCMTTIHRPADGGLLAVTKGAAEVVLAAAVSVQRSAGAGAAAASFDPAAIGRVAEQMAAEGLRVLAVGVRRLAACPDTSDPASVERDLEFVGLLGLMDPPRPEAAAAIAACHAAGITPVMITGDHPVTARAIAARLGLEVNDGTVMSGQQLAALSAQQLAERVKHVRVYARVAPEQKLDIVTALQAQGEVVAMTGDGVNDAPALRRADIGVAMGITGTDVAREAGSMVLLDDNFATVVRAVREGRRIYDNLRRFIRYVLTTNSGEIWTIFLAPFVGLPMPLLPIHILWINLVTDGLPGLALAAEPEEPDVMRRPPRPPRESLFAQGLGLHALLVGMLMAALALGAQAWYLGRDAAQWQTVVFTTLCFMQLGHVLAIRSERSSLFSQGLWSNRPLALAVALTVLLQLAVVYTPLGNAWFRTVPLSVADLAVCVGAALVIVAVVELEKAVRRRAGGKPASAPRDVMAQ